MTTITDPIEHNEQQLNQILDNIKESLFANCDFDTPEQLSAAITYIQYNIEPFRYFMEVEADDDEIFNNEGC